MIANFPPFWECHSYAQLNTSFFFSAYMRAQVHLRLGGCSSLYPTKADRALSLGTGSSVGNQDQGTSLLSQWPAVSTPPKKEFV